MVISRLCREGEHDWCANRDYEECHCECSCHSPRMKFKGVKFNPGSWALGVHSGRNPVNGKRFVCIMPLPMITIDFGE